MNTPHTRWEGDDLHGRRRKLTYVWVRLDAVLGRQPGDPVHTVPDGLDLAGAVRGRLTGWLRSVTGEWLGIVDYEVPYADGRRDQVHLTDQLVPARALRRYEEK